MVLDPPWRYSDTLPGDTRGASNHYQTMMLDQIKAIQLPIDRSGAHVYLWTTNAFIAEAFEVFRAWGVDYKTTITWVKVTKVWGERKIDAEGAPAAELTQEAVRMGMGRYWRGATEHCLFGTVGRAPALVRNQHNVIVAERTEHSRKPDLFYNRVTNISPSPRLNMFARSPREGFEAMGDQYVDEAAG